MTIRLLIADDQEMVRSAFRMILDSQPDMEVVAEAVDGAEAVEQARRLRPDVCLLDIRMPGLDGLEATRLLAGPEVSEPLNVLIATTFDLDEYVYRALRNGACGFLLKDGSPALLTEAVRAAASGDAMIAPSVTVRLLSHMASGGRGGSRPGFVRETPGATGERTGAGPRNRRAAAWRPPQQNQSQDQDGDQDRHPHRNREQAPAEELLTPRELEVVRLVARGRTNEELADELYVTLSTVKTHLANAQRKLAARNRVEIAAWAWENNLCSG